MATLLIQSHTYCWWSNFVFFLCLSLFLNFLKLLLFKKNCVRLPWPTLLKLHLYEAIKNVIRNMCQVLHMLHIWFAECDLSVTGVWNVRSSETNLLCTFLRLGCDNTWCGNRTNFAAFSSLFSGNPFSLSIISVHILSIDKQIFIKLFFLINQFIYQTIELFYACSVYSSTFEMESHRDTTLVWLL